MSSRIPSTEWAVLRKCEKHSQTGLYCPTGPDYKRAHALLRRGILEPVHGRKGDGIEHFRLTSRGRELLSITDIHDPQLRREKYKEWKDNQDV